MTTTSISSFAVLALSIAGCGPKVATVDPDPSESASDPDALQRLHDEVWDALARHDDALLGDTLTVLRHPDADLSGDEPLPIFSHHCGDEARRVGRAYLDVSPTVNDWQCNELRCSHHLHHGARAVFVFRLDASERPKLWVVGEDYEWDGDIPSAPLLHEAIRRAQRHRCP